MAGGLSLNEIGPVWLRSFRLDALDVLAKASFVGYGGSNEGFLYGGPKDHKRV